MDKKNAKRKAVRDQTLLLNEVRTFTGKHLTQSDVGEVSRGVTNTGKYAVPVYYIRVHEDDPETISQRLASIRENISVFSKQGIILCIKGGETALQGWERVILTVEEQKGIDKMRTMFKRVELPKLEWEGNQITATRTTDPVLDPKTAAPMLWSPTDKTALPSPEDMIHAKKAIITLEDALRDAFELIESTKLRIAEMKKDLAERKGWIAPIRKVPTEVLIDILLRTSEMDDLAPVKFTAVSRLWRSIILTTPKAWSFIHLLRNYERHVDFRNHKGDHDYFPGYKETYFKRSRPRLLHLSLPEVEGFWPKHSTSIIREIAPRILCLTTSTDILSDNQSFSRCQRFPNLQTLTVDTPCRGDGESLDASFFSISRLPALQTLRLSLGCELTDRIISPTTFPPLQHLTVDIGIFSACMDILQSCAGTLKTLSISCSDEPDTTGSPIGITFPLLRCLTIGRDPSTSPAIVKAITPLLSSLVVDSRRYSMPVLFDADMQNVTHMRWSEFKAPPICRHVRVLQIMIEPAFVNFQSPGYADYAIKLKETAAAYPSLETIEISPAPTGYDRLHSTQQKVEECLGQEFVKPRVLWTKIWQEDLPGYVATTCGKNMPCVPLPRKY